MVLKKVIGLFYLTTLKDIRHKWIINFPIYLESITIFLHHVNIVVPYLYIDVKSKLCVKSQSCPTSNHK